MNFTVLMSVYGKEKPDYLAQSLASLQSQTLLATEVVLVEDGPLGAALLEVIERYRKLLNIRSVRLPRNEGLARALNEGIKHCQYELVARMDSDDIAISSRFEQQIDFMNTHPEVAAVSAYIEEFNDENEQTSLRLLPTEHEDIVRFSKQRSPLSHPAVMFRKNVIISVGGYPNFRKAQDYALWTLLIVHGFRLANIPSVLVRMRTGDGLLNRRGVAYLKKEIELMQFQRNLGHISVFEFYFNVAARSILRCAPNGLKRFIYSVLR